MEIIEEYEDPRDNEPVEFDLPTEKIDLLIKRGFFPTSSKLIDDKYYNTRKDVKRNTHLKERISVPQLVSISIEEMEQLLFMKDSMIPMPVTLYSDEKQWRDSFGSYTRFYDVDPLCLEPYIAKYVRAINRCGIETVYSCDGWHEKPKKSREIVIQFRDRYGWSWHKQLCELNSINEYCPWEYINEGAGYCVIISLLRDDKQKLEIYNQVLLAADVFVEQCVSLKRLKESFVSHSLESEMDSLSNSEVEILFGDFFIKHFSPETI